MTAPVLESFTSDVGQGEEGDYPVLTKPANVATGDLLLIFVCNDDTFSNNQTVTPSGFTLLQHVGDSTRDCHALVFYRIADGTEASTVTVEIPDNDEGVAWYLRVSGADTTTPFGSSIITDLGVSNQLNMGGLGRDDESESQLGFVLCAFDGGDSDMGLIAPSSWDNYNSDRATSNSALASAGRYLEEHSSGSSSSGAWSTRTKSGSGGFGLVKWAFAVFDGAVGIGFTVNPAAGGTFQGKLGDLTVSKMYLGDTEVTGGYLGDIDLWA